MAFILMGLVVFAFFRTFAPSVAVIVAAFSDIFETMAFMRLFNIELSLAGFAALLMLIGYSVDTDILLTTRMLKKKGGDMFEKAKSAFNTGIGMTVATLGALASIALLSVSAVLSQIAIILIIGLIVDIVNTWLQNVAILLWYCKKHKIGES